MVTVEEADISNLQVGLLGKDLNDLWVRHHDQIHQHLAEIYSTFATLNFKTGDSVWLLRMPRTSYIIRTIKRGSSLC